MIEKEKKLQQEKIAELMDSINIQKEAEADNGHYYAANILGKCFNWLHRLHMDNVALAEENDAMTHHWEFHFSGLAMQSIVNRAKGDGLDVKRLTQASFQIAEEMVKYGKEKSKTKGTEDGLGTTSSEDSYTKQP
jgi:hypothetical protein